MPSYWSIARSLKDRGASAMRRASSQLLFGPRVLPAAAGPTPRAARPRDDYDWARSPAARRVRSALFNLVVRPMVLAFAPPAAVGRELLEDLEPPVIICSNHLSHFDTPVILSTLPSRLRERTVVAAAADYFFRTRLRGMASALALNAIPIERQRADRASLDLATRLIEEGFSVIVFPEGGRSPDGWGRDFRPGAGYLAAKTARPVVPAYIHGTQRVMPKSASLPRRHPVKVLYGRPIEVAPGTDPRELTRRIEEAVASLALEARDGYYRALIDKASAVPALKGPPTNSWLRYWRASARFEDN